jgi:hypothetical protein
VGLVDVPVVFDGGTTGAGDLVVVVCVALGEGLLVPVLGAGWLAGTLGAALAGTTGAALEPPLPAPAFFFARLCLTGLLGCVVTVFAVVAAAAAACVAVGVLVV